MPDRAIQAAKRRQALGIGAFLFLVAGGVSVAYHLIHGDAVAYHRGEQAFARGDYAGALPHYEIARAAGLQAPPFDWHHATALMETGRAAEALPLLEGILARDPTNRAALIAAVGVAQATRDPAAGIALYARLGPREKLPPADLARLVDLYQQAGQLDDAVACQRLLVAAYPERADQRTLLGELLLRADQRDAALVEFEAVLRLDPAQRPARLALARLHAWAGRFDDAATAYRAYLGEN